MKAILQAFKLLWRTSKFTLLFLICIQLSVGFIPAAKLLITSKLINEVASIIDGSTTKYNSAIFLILIQLLISAGLFALMRLQELITIRLQFKLDYQIEKDLIQKINYISYEMYEYPDFYNHLNRVTNGGSIANHLIVPVKSVISTVSGCIALTSIIIILYQVHWSLVLVSLASFLPYLYYNSRFGKQTFSLMVFQTPTKRKMSYFRSLLYDKNSVKEVRLFNLNSYFINKWENLYLKNMKESLNLTTKQEYTRIMLDVLKLGFYSLASILVLILITNRKAKIGDFVTSVQAIEQIQSHSAGIASEIANVYSNLFYIEDYFKLLNLIEQEKVNNSSDIENYKIVSIEKIEFKNASFVYPNSEKKVLSNINLTIHTGEKLAIVGENGSGKTTLIHCLMGLYELKEGEILINDINIKLLDMQAVRKKCTVIFQNFMRYAFSIKDNILVGDIEQYNSADCNRKLYSAATKSGVLDFTENLKDKFDTQLGKVFEDGVDLSGGQWQKIAIARSIFRESDLIILDEPTAALDPRSEYEIYKQFENLTNDKIAIYISHRLAYTKNVDKIVVLRDGEIIEEGTHSDLIKLNQVYYEMYNMQSDAYKEDKLHSDNKNYVLS
ncbi:ABC transporter ATP-binding protein [Bacillus toyonensis]|uniref:ABC transporter ATP-binding protein n=1 Tax=Bacillus toyonensis TaxID=155322 RepID=UPI002175887B|nr:ABC transporter ATP-binding protein [Bacillus toyonensis]